MSKPTEVRGGCDARPWYPGRVEWGRSAEGLYCGVCAVGHRVDYQGPWLTDQEGALEGALQWLYAQGYRYPHVAGRPHFRPTRIAGLYVAPDRAGERLSQGELFGGHQH